MAEIPVEKKSGMPWWGWILAALAALALIWFFFGQNIENEVDAQSSVTSADSAASVASHTTPAPSVDDAYATYL